MHTNEQSRSCALQEFAGLSELQGVSFYSLQKGPGMEQADNPPANLKLVNLGKELDLNEAFVDTAAVMAYIDMIITINTLCPSGRALGRPVWVLLCTTPDWRWMQDRDDSPWYPGMKLFRQVDPGQWSTVFQRVAQNLRQLFTNNTA